MFKRVMIAFFMIFTLLGVHTVVIDAYAADGCPAGKTKKCNKQLGDSTWPNRCKLSKCVPYERTREYWVRVLIQYVGWTDVMASKYKAVSGSAPTNACPQQIDSLF